MQQKPKTSYLWLRMQFYDLILYVQTLSVFLWGKTKYVCNENGNVMSKTKEILVNVNIYDMLHTTQVIADYII